MRSRHVVCLGCLVAIATLGVIGLPLLAQQGQEVAPAADAKDLPDPKDLSLDELLAELSLPKEAFHDSPSEELRQSFKVSVTIDTPAFKNALNDVLVPELERAQVQGSIYRVGAEQYLVRDDWACARFTNRLEWHAKQNRNQVHETPLSPRQRDCLTSLQMRLNLEVSASCHNHNDIDKVVTHSYTGTLREFAHRLVTQSGLAFSYVGGDIPIHVDNAKRSSLQMLTILAAQAGLRPRVYWDAGSPDRFTPLESWRSRDLGASMRVSLMELVQLVKATYPDDVEASLDNPIHVAGCIRDVIRKERVALAAMGPSCVIAFSAPTAGE